VGIEKGQKGGEFDEKGGKAFFGMPVAKTALSQI
jgi:hypothetical protein